MRVLLIKNNGQKIVAVSHWDGVSHFNIPRAHTLVASDNLKMTEGATCDIGALQAQATVDAENRAAAQKNAEADSAARRLSKAKALAGEPAPAA